MDRAAFTAYLLEIMRRRAGAEVALLDTAALADTPFPMRGALSREMLLRAIRTPATLGTVSLTGAKLTELLEQHLEGEKGLQVRGLDKDGEAWTVNGRALIKGQRYRVSTTAFVAGGGDELLDLDKEDFTDSGSSLRGVAESFFSGGGQAALDGDPGVDSSTDFSSPEDRLLLSGSVELTLAMSNVSVDNGAAGGRYSRPLLRRDSEAGLSAELKLLAGADTLDHVLELDLLLQYEATWTRKQAEQDYAFNESQDLLRVELMYRLRKLRGLAAGRPRWIPEPFASAVLTSELTASGTYQDRQRAAQTYHYLELGGIAGLGWSPHPLLFLKGGGVVRGELLTPEEAHPDIPLRGGLYAGATLRRLRLLGNDTVPLEGAARLDFYFTELDGDLRRDLTFRADLYLQVFERLSLTLGYRLYWFDTRSKDASVAHDVSLGLNLALDLRRQTY